MTGVAVHASDPGGHDVSLTTGPSTNYSLPDVLTSGGNANLATSVTYASSFAVASVTGPNGANGTTAYDNFGRLQNTKIPDGAQTDYTYTYNPNVQTAQIGTGATARWKKTTLDGFGRPIPVVTGNGTANYVSGVDTEYAPCACSPLGKLYRVSQPYQPDANGNPPSPDTRVWTTYAYDESGRTLTVTAPDGSVTSTVYAGNKTTVTDPAGKWKTSVTEAVGNLTHEFDTQVWPTSIL